MRLLELPHKCPKAKELKNASEHRRTLNSSLGAVLDKLEDKWGDKLYTTRFQHPSMIAVNASKSGGKNNNNSHSQSSQLRHASVSRDAHAHKQVAAETNEITHHEKNNVNPASTSSRQIADDINVQCMPVMSCVSYEAKQEETEENSTKQSVQHHCVGNDDDGSGDMQESDAMQDRKDDRDGDSEDLYNNNNVHEFNAPKYRNETVRFHVRMQQEESDLSMTQRFEQLQQEQQKKIQNIHAMKQEYERIAQDLDQQYAFHSKPFQDTASSDYALFQLESIKQKLSAKQHMHTEKGSIEPMDEDGVDTLLTSISSTVQNWTNTRS
mmetsp:Transcript_30772/g.50006  ORF Transcript_30772/g.50006 Transcript_30772/m.50006 type:complete len:324 (+) Transcript_30772:1-972(+)